LRGAKIDYNAGSSDLRREKYVLYGNSAEDSSEPTRAAIVLYPRGIFPELLSTTILAGAFPFGKGALILALLGSVACEGELRSRQHYLAPTTCASSSI
jgi:hypothetical protein